MFLYLSCFTSSPYSCQFLLPFVSLLSSSLLPIISPLGPIFNVLHYFCSSSLLHTPFPFSILSLFPFLPSVSSSIYIHSSHNPSLPPLSSCSCPYLLLRHVVSHSLFPSSHAFVLSSFRLLMPLFCPLSLVLGGPKSKQGNKQVRKARRQT